MGSAVNIALPAIGREFGMDAILLNWTATIYLLSSAMFLLPVGRLADIYGRKRIFNLGIIVFTLMNALLIFAPNAPLFLLFRMIQGFGSAMIFGTGMAILTLVYPPGERGRVMGISVAGVYTGLSMGPVLGGLLTHHFGWQAIFAVNIPMGIVIIFLVFKWLRLEWADAAGEKFDLAGSALYAVALALLIFGLSRLPSWYAAILCVTGAAALALFLRQQAGRQNPLVNIGLFRQNKVFAFSNLAAFLNYSATFGVTFLGSLYLQYIKGLSPREAGLLLLAQPVVMTVLSPVAGRLSDRIEPRIVSSAGMALSSAGLVLCTFLNAESAKGYFIACLMILGTGFALFSSPNANAVMSSVEKRFYGVASATLGTMRLTGQMFSMAVSMLIFVLLIGPVQITPAYYPCFLKSMKIAFTCFAGLCFLGVFASLSRGKIR
jgi:EmrB/QacA subfamily drug resistance transporter